MPTTSKSRTTTKAPRVAALLQRRLPTHRPPTHPGEMLLEECLKPLGISQSAFAIQLGVSVPRFNEVVNGRRSVTAGPGIRSRAALAADIRANVNTIWHPVGTCRMGSDPMSVVDARLRVHGVEGLRVADASIMPRIVNANTNAACTMIGERAASLMQG